MNQPEPQSLPFAILMSDIEKGLIKIPQFQRDFVWGRDKSAKLLDSILRGFPVGTFIVWKTREALRAIRNIGGASLPDTPEGDAVQYVLDGQQRLTSLFACAKGLVVERGGHRDDFSSMYVDLRAEGDAPIVLLDEGARNDGSVIRIVDLLTADLTFLAEFPKVYHSRLSQYRKTLESYLFSVVLVKDAPLDIATEIFTRINVSGKQLTVFEIMVAKTFDAKSGFDLAQRVDSLLSEFESVGYETIRPEVILQAISVLLRKECAKKDILLLKKADIISIWEPGVNAMRSAIDYLRNYFRVPVSRLLPFGAMLVPITYFFHRHPEKPIGPTADALMDFFWRVALTGYYSHSLETKIAKDIKRIDRILDGELPEYDDAALDISPEFIFANGYFSTGRSYAKAILCLLAFQEPKSFADNSIVRISNDWLKQTNSKNYHHFFPRAFLRKSGHDEKMINHVANITIVDDFMNKRLIGELPPSVYLPKFAASNPRLAETLRTHLIDLDGKRVWMKDYETFIHTRCAAFSVELGKRIIPRSTDRSGQTASDDLDIEEGEA